VWVVFNIFPDKTYAYKAESSHGGKMSKHGITVLLCANVDGYEKLSLLVNGKICEAKVLQTCEVPVMYVEK
jgi:hypothetical protein